MRRATRARRRFSVMAAWKTGVGFSLSPGLRGPRSHAGRRRIRPRPIAAVVTLFGQRHEHGAWVRAEIRLIESGEAVEIVESERPDAAGPAGPRGPGPTDHLVLALKSETLVERDRVQVGVQPDRPHACGA